jgi:hypothetical protein
MNVDNIKSNLKNNMNKVNDKVKEVKENLYKVKEKVKEKVISVHHQNKFIIPLILSIILIIIILIIYFNYKKNRKNNPSFFTTPLSGKNNIILNESEVFPNGRRGSPYNLTYHLFIYIKDWNYQYGITKEIFQKGNSLNMCPGLYLSPKLNNILVKIKTNNGIKNIKVKDIEINRWFHLAIVIDNLSVTIYHNGNVISNNVLPSVCVINNDDLIINGNGGFNGLIYNLCIINKVLSSKEILKLSKKKPPTNAKYFK